MIAAVAETGPGPNDQGKPVSWTGVGGGRRGGPSEICACDCLALFRESPHAHAPADDEFDGVFMWAALVSTDFG